MEENPVCDTHNNFKINDFEGPLDVLLFLIKKSEINIYDIPISQITEQYIHFIEYASSISLDNLTEFYVMASTLLYIKSRMLLPVEIDVDEELEDPRKELVERLIEYQKFKKLSDLMTEKETESEWRIERTKKQRALPFPEDERLWEQVDIWDLFQTFSTIINSLSSERIIDMYEEVSINEKVTLMYELFEDRNEIRFTDLIIRENSIMDIVCAFLAILEAVKQKRISIFQNKLFGDIAIRKREEQETGELEDVTDEEFE
ncbi:MAG: segregation/condensation protein A [Spirochaetales bacterium]|nr:segregation/condensation protein A [Spirochaetales bacterium]